MTRAVILIKTEHLLSARALAQAAPFSLSEDEANHLFVPAGSPTGNAPATYYWIAGLFTPENLNAIQGLAMLLPWADCCVYDIDTDPSFPYAKLTELGLLPMKGDLT